MSGSQKKILVIGVDPGSRIVGYGVIELLLEDGIYRYIESGTIEPESGAEVTDRLEYIYDEFTKLVKKHTALNRQVVQAQERFFARGGMRGGDLVGKACGVLQLAGRKAGVDVFVEINKTTANKVVVGKSGTKRKKLTKQDVQKAVKNKLGIPKDEEMMFDASDALTVALTAILNALEGRKETLKKHIKIRGVND